MENIDKLINYIANQRALKICESVDPIKYSNKNIKSIDNNGMFQELEYKENKIYIQKRDYIKLNDDIDESKIVKKYKINNKALNLETYTYPNENIALKQTKAAKENPRILKRVDEILLDVNNIKDPVLHSIKTIELKDKIKSEIKFINPAEIVRNLKDDEKWITRDLLIVKELKRKQEPSDRIWEMEISELSEIIDELLVETIDDKETIKNLNKNEYMIDTIIITSSINNEDKLRRMENGMNNENETKKEIIEYLTLIKLNDLEQAQNIRDNRLEGLSKDNSDLDIFDI